MQVVDIGSRFTVVMPEIGAEQAREMAEKCRVSFLGDGTISKYQLTASFGIASFLPDGSPFSDIVDSAVEAMYAAKRAEASVSLTPKGPKYFHGLR